MNRYTSVFKDITVCENGLDLTEVYVDGDPGFMQSILKIGKKKEILKNL